MKRILLFLLGFVFSSFAEVCNDPIRCKLNSIVISVPDFCLSDQDICINNFSCGNVDVNNLPSTYLKPTSLEVGMKDLTASCAFDYTYSKHLKGSVTASVSDTDFLIDLFVEQDVMQYLPISTSFASCNMSSIVVDITFDSSELNNLTPILEKVVKVAINRALCVKAADFVATNITEFILNTLDPQLLDVISSTPSTLPVYDSKYYLSWSDSIISKMHSLVDHIKGLSSGGNTLQCLLDSKPSLLNKVFPSEIFKKQLQDESFESIALDLSDQQLNLPLSGSNLSISLVNVEIFGLNSVQDFTILEPVKESNVSLHTLMSFQSVSMNIRIRVNSTITPYSEELLLVMELEDLSVLADLVIAVNEFVLSSFKLDQLVLPNCWFSVLSEFSIANLQLATKVNKVSIIQVEGDASSLEFDVVNLLNNALELVYSGFPSLLTDTLNGLMQGPIRNGVNDHIERNLKEAHSNSPCLSHYPHSDITNYVIWSDSTIVTFLSTLLDDKLGAAGMNQIMNCVTNYTGVLALNTTRINVEVGGLNSFYELDVLSTNTEPYLLGNTLGVGSCHPNEQCNPLRLIMSTYDLIDDPNTLEYIINEFVNKFKIEVSVTNLELILDLFWKMNKNGMKDISFGQLSTTGCSASTISDLHIDNFRMSVGTSDLVINDVTYNITKLVDGFMNALTNSDFVDKRNQEMEYKLSVSEETCMANGVAPAVVTGESEDKSKSLSTLQWSLIAVGGVLFTFCCIAYYRHYQMSIKDQRWFWERYDFSQALIYDPRISKWIRYGYPVAIVCVFVLFVYSDLQDIARAMMKIITPEKIYDIGEVYNFKFGSVSQDMWDAKVYALDTLMVALSGVWPNIKLAIMLFTWVVPLDLLSSSKRESIMIVVDVLGKWSLIDFFVMILLLCAFYFQLNFGDNIIVDVTMRPSFGFYGFLLATMLSQLLGHLLLACHRASLREDGDDINENKESLSSLKFEMDVSEAEVSSFVLTEQRTKSERKKKNILLVGVTTSGIVVIVILIILTGVLLAAGTYKLVMTFEFKGMVGWILKDSAIEHYSFINMGRALPKHSGIPNTVGIIWFQIAFFSFGIGFPVLLLIASLIHWLVPLSIVHQERLLTISEIFNSWSALDVYSVSIIAALFEIQQFAEFMIGDSCDRINELLKYFDDALEGDDKCFDVVALLLPDAWICFLAAICINFVGMWTLHLSVISLKQRQRRVVADESVDVADAEHDGYSVLKNSEDDQVDKVEGLTKEEDDEPKSSYLSSYFRCGQISLIALLHRIHLITVNHHQKWSSSY